MKTLYIAIVTATFLFFGCDETKKVIDTAGSVQLSGNYTITSAMNKTVTGVDKTITFSALDKSFRGNAGCNTFFGNYTLDLYALNFGDIASTENYCDEAIMQKENAILEALRETGSYTLENDVLTLLSNKNRSVILKAEKIKN